MATPTLPPDFKEFLQLLNANGVEYLLVGGYAVAYYGYVRAMAALQQFGFQVPPSAQEHFLKPDNIVRLGVPPLRVEIITTVFGVQFAECYAKRVVDTIDGVPVSIIGLPQLKTNKLASGRGKDLVDIEHLP